VLFFSQMKFQKKRNLTLGGFFEKQTSVVTPEKVVAIDCEMVGGVGGKDLLVRVSIVAYSGKVLLDAFVKPSEVVKDYRTDITGVDADILRKSGKPHVEVVAQATSLLQDKLVVGHGLNNDFEALGYTHPAELVRDTAGYKPLRPEDRDKKIPALRFLVSHWLGRDIQKGSHSSVEDARFALQLYKKVSSEWEASLKPKTANVRGRTGKVNKKVKKTA
jgi:RNA exonuclease 4